MNGGSQTEALLSFNCAVKPTGMPNDRKTNVKFMNNKKSHFVILYSLCESTERLKEGDQIVKVEEGMIDTFPLKEDD